jgi:hypothetical protein
MKLVRVQPGGRDRLCGAMVVAALLAVGLSAAAWLRLGLPVPGCTLKDWTGLPCLTCGSTRLVQALLRGDVLEAAAWNPLVFSALALVTVWAAASTIRSLLGLASWRLVLTSAERRAASLTAVSAVIGGWVYLILRGV